MSHSLNDLESCSGYVSGRIHSARDRYKRIFPAVHHQGWPAYFLQSLDTTAVADSGRQLPLESLWVEAACQGCAELLPPILLASGKPRAPDHPHRLDRVLQHRIHVSTLRSLHEYVLQDITPGLG